MAKCQVISESKDFVRLLELAHLVSRRCSQIPKSVVHTTEYYAYSEVDESLMGESYLNALAQLRADNKGLSERELLEHYFNRCKMGEAHD